MRLSEAAEKLIMAKVADGKSQKTIRDYRQKLAPMIEHLSDKEVEAVTVDDLRGYVAHLRSRTTRYPTHPNHHEKPGGLSPASIAGYVRVMKLFFCFLHEESYIPSDPAKAIRAQRPPRGEPKACGMNDLQALLDATEGNKRDEALLLFLADTGCRVGGLVGLRIQDVNLARRTAQIKEKGEKTRVVHFSETTAQSLREWIAVRPATGNDFVFINLTRQSYQQMTTGGVEEVMRRLKKRSGVTGPSNPHSFRHAFAREYIKSGGDMGSLADLLGHSNMETTWRSYAIFTNDELRVKHQQHSPIAVMERNGVLF